MTEEAVGVAKPTLYDASWGKLIKRDGRAYRKTSVTYAVQIPHDFAVETNEGVLTAQAGDFLAYDEKSGHVWPVAAAYVEQNYEQSPLDEDAISATLEAAKASTPASSPLYAAFEALERVTAYLSARDVADAERNLWQEATYSPLTRLCGDAAHGLLEHIRETIGLVTGEHVGLGHDAPVTALTFPEPPAR